MLSHRLRVILLATAALGLATTASMRASVDAHRTEYLTFSRSVALPGVALGSGTYIFEFPDPEGAYDVVRVLSRDRKIVYLTAHTSAVSRPEIPSQTKSLSFGEAAPDSPVPVAIWWSDGLAGRQFIYPLR